jgi:hypothetical protein
MTEAIEIIGWVTAPLIHDIPLLAQRIERCVLRQGPAAAGVDRICWLPEFEPAIYCW